MSLICCVFKCSGDQRDLHVLTHAFPTLRSADLPTGDLARVDHDGHLYFIARRGDMIKSKAANVSRLEVEAALRGLPGVELPDRKSTRLNSSHSCASRLPSSA